eukprot:10691955-Karenia_brevis.AAC.1
MLRYVDDLFAPEMRQTVEHALQCVVRLIKVFLGSSSVSERKVAFNTEELCILGVDVAVSEKGFRFHPAASKVARWLRDIKFALKNGKLVPGLASKLAGRLSWSCTH